MKDLILEAAEKEIRQSGLNFTMDDLARNLGMSKKTIYTKYKGKEDIIGQLIYHMKKDIEAQQIDLFNDESVPHIEKLKGLIKILPKDTTIATPMILNQLRKSFPKLYAMMNKIYHQDWDRFNAVYEDAVEKGIIEPFDLVFFKEMYISCVTSLPEADSLIDMSYKEIVSKTVDQLFLGIGK